MFVENLLCIRHMLDFSSIALRKTVHSLRELTIQFGRMMSESESVSCSIMSDSLQPYVLQSVRPLCPWNSPGKNTGVGSHFLLQGIFPTQGSNPGLLHCREILYCLSYQGSPWWVDVSVALWCNTCHVRSRRGCWGRKEVKKDFLENSFKLSWRVSSHHLEMRVKKVAGVLKVVQFICAVRWRVGNDGIEINTQAISFQSTLGYTQDIA